MKRRYDLIDSDILATAVEGGRSGGVVMDEDFLLILDPAERLRTVMHSAVPEVNSAVPLNRYYRSLNEIYRVAGFCVKERDIERAFSLYLRFVSLALEELPKHKEFQGFTSAEKTKAEASLAKAFENAEILKEQLKEKFEQDAVRARKIVEERKAEAKRAPIPAKVPAGNGVIVPPSTANHISPGISTNFIHPALPSAPPAVLSEGVPEGKVPSGCTIVVAGQIVEKFKKQVERNTSMNIETCAVLCGNMTSGSVYRITHAVIPKQDGAPDSCDMHNEEDIFAFQDSHNLITLGWIHTHPSQTAFLSSVDLHTHCAYQLMLPEALAIVVAPKFNQVGVFRLSPKGMQEVGGCRKSGFHPHENTASLFYHCADVRFDPALDAQVVDLR